MGDPQSPPSDLSRPVGGDVRPVMIVRPLIVPEQAYQDDGTDYDPLAHTAVGQTQHCASASHRSHVRMFKFASELINGLRCSHFWSWLRCQSVLQYLSAVRDLHPEDFLRIAHAEYQRALSTDRRGMAMVIRHRILRHTMSGRGGP